MFESTFVTTIRRQQQKWTKSLLIASAASFRSDVGMRCFVFGILNVNFGEEEGSRRRSFDTTRTSENGTFYGLLNAERPLIFFALICSALPQSFASPKRSSVDDSLWVT
ncbi:hypothetical protein L596_028151 [Steinernema carpocapsae]|uniref:Uncharacterized protein n=1 Tax=Steinernema carpocapsae TaxID=34508 RepID=A0A4V5ZXT2_STECR|nr:hypothetical protein L596_028151 [Steinernema carpocapsae]